MRLEITRRADLATRALIALAGSDRRFKSSDLAAVVGTTRGFLAHAMTPLVSRGWVSSEPGPTGGYAIAVDLDDVSVLDVIEAIEGPTDTGRCVLEDRPCANEGPCALHTPWMRARAQLLNELAATRLSQLNASGRAG
ncbi:MAG: Rrf2 family transcriptional regulator [Acidimicrobiales bacterium]